MDRVKKLREYLKEKKLDAVLISSVPNITYLTGLASFSPFEREAYLLVSNKTQYIFTDGRYSEAVSKKAPTFILKERSQGSPFKSLLSDLTKKEEIRVLGIEEDNLTIREFKTIKKIAKLRPIEVRTHRAVKERFETDLIKKACQIGDRAFNETLKKIKTGTTEKEVAFYLEESIRKQGGYLSFPFIVAFGENSSIPHHQTSDKALTAKQGQFVLMDFGVMVDGYCSDMTRTIFFGKASDKQKNIYQTVYKAQELVANMRGDLKAAKLDRKARDYIIKEGYPSIPHSLGHGVGLEIHEHPYLSPKSKEDLKEGMVFSIEPGIYIPSFGGVRIEDLYLLSSGRLVQLTRSPKRLIELGCP